VGEPGGGIKGLVGKTSGFREHGTWYFARQKLRLGMRGILVSGHPGKGSADLSGQLGMVKK
jgi:hypothetical protein